MDIIYETEEAECQAQLRGASVFFAKRLSWLTVQGRECKIKTKIEH